MKQIHFRRVQVMIFFGNSATTEGLEGYCAVPTSSLTGLVGLTSRARVADRVAGRRADELVRRVNLPINSASSSISAQLFSQSPA